MKNDMPKISPEPQASERPTFLTRFATSESPTWTKSGLNSLELVMIHHLALPRPLMSLPHLTGSNAQISEMETPNSQGFEWLLPVVQWVLLPWPTPIGKNNFTSNVLRFCVEGCQRHGGQLICSMERWQGTLMIGATCAAIWPTVRFSSKAVTQKKSCTYMDHKIPESWTSSTSKFG